MKKVLRLAVVAVALTLPGSPAVNAQGAARAEQTRTAPDAKLKALYDGYAEWNARESGYFEDSRGETRPADYLAHVDEGSQPRYAAHLRELLAQVECSDT